VSVAVGTDRSDSVRKSRGLNIALVSVKLPNESGSKQGGVDYHVHRLANHLVDAGHPVTIFSADPAPADARYAVEAIPAPRWATATRIGRLYALSVFLNRIPLQDFDVVHTHGDDSFFFSRKRVRSLHGSALGEAMSATSWRRRVGIAPVYLLELFSALTARVAIAQSRATHRHFPFVRNVIPYGVDTSLYRPGGKTTTPTVLFVGTITGRKRGQLVLDAFNHVIRPQMPEAQLWMVADEAVGSPGVVDFGKVKSEQRMAELYRSAWVFCMPSTYEGLGLPYLEAMASGTAVVSTPNPGAIEVLRHGEDGLIVDVDQLGQSLLKLLRSSKERQLLETAGRQRAAEYSWEKLLPQYVDVYSQVTAKTARSTIS
jgi:phosphatidyl-myo-inositol alpha-mannosyltransferase